MREHEYSSLVQIQSWSEIPRGVPLFESLVVVQNTPAVRANEGKVASSDHKDTLEVRSCGEETSADFPLCCMHCRDIR